MVKRINITLLLCMFSILAFPQFNYFNERFSYGSPSNIDVSRSILEVDQGYIVGGMSDLNIFGTYYLSFRKFDYQGNEVWTKTFGEPGKQYWIGEPGSLIKTSDGGYLMCGTYKDNSVITDAALLVKFGESFDTLWTKKRADTVSPSNYLYYYFQCKEVTNVGYIIAGIKKPYGEPSKIHLVKTDYFGEIIWEKVFGAGNYYYQSFSIVITTDGGYAIGGYRFHIGQNETADPIIYKTDSLGNLEWQKNIGGPYFDYHPMLTLSNDGKIIAGTCKADSMLSPNYSYSKINIIKMDNQGNEEWNKEYGNSEIDNYFFQIRTLDDGNGFIASGALINDFPHYSGWLLKIDQNGDSLWYRQYDNLLGEDSWNYLYDVIPTSDNGFAACGYVIPFPPDEGNQDAWVLKVDSLGCDTAGCATGTFVHELLSPSGGGQGEELHVFPNPTTNKLHVEVQSSFHEGLFRKYVGRVINIYNSQGTKIKEIKIPQNTETISIDLTNHPKGIYYLRLVCDGATVGTAKVVKL